MSQRDTINQQRVDNVVSTLADNTEALIGAAGQEIAKQSSEAKIAQNQSKVQVDLAGLQNQYKIDSQSDPIGGFEKYKADRQKLFDTYGKDVSPFFRRQWDDDMFKVAKINDAQTLSWAYEQTHKNSIMSINDSMRNYLGLATADGEKYGKSQTTDLAAFTSFEQARQSLESYGNKNLGVETTKKMLEDFQDDYIKTFVSGAVQSNPDKGLKLLDQQQVKDAIKNPEHYASFRSAVEHRAAAVKKNMQQGDVVNGIRRDNDPLMKNGGSMNYTELQQSNLSPDAKEYYSALNGFSGSGKRGGFTPEDKQNYKLQVYDAVHKLSTDKDMDAGSVRVVQDAVYKAMNKGAMSQAEGMDFIKQITDPLLAKKEEAMSKFSEDHWFKDDIGFGGIQDYYDKNIAKPTDGLPKDMKRSLDVDNANSKAKLYDYYMGTLNAKAVQYGATVAQIPDLPAAQRHKIYSEAQTDAQTMYLKDKHPALRTLPDTPNFVYTADGALVQGLAGKRDVPVTGTANGDFRVMRDKKDHNKQYRVYKDGRIEPLGDY